MGVVLSKVKKNEFFEEISFINNALAVEKTNSEVLKNLDCFVLDNSIRESTVGQLRGHTIDNKWIIYNTVKRCGFKHIIVASFSHMTRVDDEFVQELRDKGEDMSTLYSFTEITEGVTNGVLDTETIPAALAKMKKFGLPNAIIEIDLADSNVDWESKFPVERLCQLLLKRIVWIQENLAKDGFVLVNFRDLPMAMLKKPQRILKVLKYLATLPEDKRPFGVVYEDPSGKTLPEVLGIWTVTLRKVMDENGWKSGKLLVHVHEKWGLANATQLRCLSNGANGIWSSICEEGAAMGHACSSVTLMNLVRMGNKVVLDRYNCSELRKAAQEVTRITTNQTAHPKQVVYGERALDIVFDLHERELGEKEFDIAKFFGEKPPMRITSLASFEMIQEQLVQLFGEDPQFTIEQAKNMHELIIEDMKDNRKEEYMSEVGIALLFDRSGGKITEAMSEIIFADTKEDETGTREVLLNEVRQRWDEWDLRDEVQGDERLQFDSFYHGFMAPYFGCFRCDDTKKAMLAIDMDNDGYIDWSEFRLYLVWALRQYPNEINDVDQLLNIAFKKGIIPAMQDEMLKPKK